MELIIFPLCLLAALVIIHWVNVYCEWRDQSSVSRPKKQPTPLEKTNEPIDFGIFTRIFGDPQGTQETQKRTPEIDCPYASPECPKSCDGCRYAVIDV